MLDVPSLAAPIGHRPAATTDVALVFLTVVATIYLTLAPYQIYHGAGQPALVAVLPLALCRLRRRSISARRSGWA